MELVDCPSVTFSRQGAKRTLPFSFPCGQGSFTAALPAGARAAAFKDSPVGESPLCVAHGHAQSVLTFQSSTLLLQNKAAGLQSSTGDNWPGVDIQLCAELQERCVSGMLSPDATAIMCRTHGM